MQFSKHVLVFTFKQTNLTIIIHTNNQYLTQSGKFTAAEEINEHVTCKCAHVWQSFWQSLLFLQCRVFTYSWGLSSNALMCSLSSHWDINASPFLVMATFALKQGNPLHQVQIVSHLLFVSTFICKRVVFLHFWLTTFTIHLVFFISNVLLKACGPLQVAWLQSV